MVKVALVQGIFLVLMVRAGRLELPRPLGQQILSLPRLPFRHARPRRGDYTRVRKRVNRRSGEALTVMRAGSADNA